MRAVQERKTFFCFKGERSNSGTFHCLSARDSSALQNGFAFADGHLRKMRERGEVA
jgi:hypothetical protein